MREVSRRARPVGHSNRFLFDDFLSLTDLRLLGVFSSRGKDSTSSAPERPRRFAATCYPRQLQDPGGSMAGKLSTWLRTWASIAVSCSVLFAQQSARPVLVAVAVPSHLDSS